MLILSHQEASLRNETRFPYKKCARGAAIYHQGDGVTYWYEVVSGIVRTCRFHTDGHRQLTGFFFAGDTFGLDRAVYEESAEAVTEITLLCHGQDTIEARDALARALGSARSCIFLLGHRTAVQRLAAFLLTIAERTGDGECGLLPMSRIDIADHLGLTMHTVSRTLSDLARRRLICFDQPSRFRILDGRRLRDLAGEADSDEGGMINRPRRVAARNFELFGD